MKPRIVHLALLAFSVAGGLAAETIYIVSGDILMHFDSATPGTIDGSVPIGGLATLESIAGIDFRPATGELFGLGIECAPQGAPAGAGACDAKLYTIDLTSGATTQVGSTFSMQESIIGFDFNPVVDRIRVVSCAGENFRLNPDTGALVTDTQLSPGQSCGAGAAYDRNNPGGVATTLFAIESQTSSVVRIGGVDGVPSPNGGVMTPVGPIGFTILFDRVTFDISPSGTAYAALLQLTRQPGGERTPEGGPSSLYTIDLATGHATLVGQIDDAAAIAMSVQPAGESLAEIPALGAWGLGALALLLALAAVRLTRRPAR